MSIYASIAPSHGTPLALILSLLLLISSSAMLNVSYYLQPQALCMMLFLFGRLYLFPIFFTPSDCSDLGFLHTFLEKSALIPSQFGFLG